MLCSCTCIVWIWKKQKKHLIETNTKCSFDRLNICTSLLLNSFSLPQLKAMPSLLRNLLRRLTFQTGDLLLLTLLLTGSAYDEFLNQLKKTRGGYLHRLCSWTSHRPYLSHFFTKAVTKAARRYPINPIDVSEVSYSPMDIAKIKELGHEK